jgi:glucose dehydrogenase
MASSVAEYDVVIIGTGVAGALIAYKLASNNLRVLMMDAGDVAPETGTRAALVAAYKTSPSKAQNSPYAGLVAPQPAADDVINGGSGRNYYIEMSDATNKAKSFLSYYERLVGGSTWHWQGLNLRMLPNDFRMGDVYNSSIPNWPITYDDLESLYCDAEYETGTAGDHDALNNLHGAYRSKPFPMGPIAQSYLDLQFKAALKGAVFEGTELRITSVPQARNSIAGFDGRPICEGYGSCIPLCPTRAKYEATFHVEKAKKLGAELLTRAIVIRLDCDEGGTITRIVYRSWKPDMSFVDAEVSGKIVVLAANAMETPKLLLMSNRQRDAGIANSSGAVGRYLMDHPIKMSYALAGDPVFPFRGPPSTSSIETLRDGAFRAQRGAFRTTLRNDGWSWPVDAPRGRDATQPGSLMYFVENQKLFGSKLKDAFLAHARRQIVVNSAVEQLPDANNRIYPSPHPKAVDELGIPRPVIEYQVDDYTRNAFKAAIRVHQQIFAAMGATYSNLQDNDMPDAGSGHVMGTTVMGTNPAKSVVNADLRSHDHSNLFIVGSSVFPTGATANPTLTIAALALRAAKTIGQNFKPAPVVGS